MNAPPVGLSPTLSSWTLIPLLLLHKVILELVTKSLSANLSQTPLCCHSVTHHSLVINLPCDATHHISSLLTAAQFLHDNGVLLHYNDHLRGLNNLYFIDPAWLCDMLAEVITVPEKNAFARNGILADANVAFLFKDTRKFPPQYLKQYLQLLERFEIALSLGDGTRLIPSMLSVSPPAYNFSTPLAQKSGERVVCTQTAVIPSHSPLHIHPSHSPFALNHSYSPFTLTPSHSPFALTLHTHPSHPFTLILRSLQSHSHPLTCTPSPPPFTPHRGAKGRLHWPPIVREAEVLDGIHPQRLLESAHH